MMMLQSGGGTAIAVPRRALSRLVCFASNINTEQLRSQLGQLQSEAETTRQKANNARLRLLRLSEAAEKLRRQAAISVQTGKEDDAREMLLQKKKVMQALEKSKTRIEFLDELSAKLNEAISIKESQLIGNVALDFGVREDSFSPVRIVSPTPGDAEDLGDGKEFVVNNQELSDEQENLHLAENQASLPVRPEAKNLQESSKRGIWNEAEIISSLQGITSFENFLEHLDNQFDTIEAELDTILRISTLVVDSHEKPKNYKVQQMMELIESVRGIRQRISTIKLEKADVI